MTSFILDPAAAGRLISIPSLQTHDFKTDDCGCTLASGLLDHPGATFMPLGHFTLNALFVQDIFIAASTRTRPAKHHRGADSCGMHRNLRGRPTEAIALRARLVNRLPAGAGIGAVAKRIQREQGGKKRGLTDRAT
jgi:hypothetical protein